MIREEFSCTLTKRMGDLGLFGPFVPEEYGGSNVGYISYIIATEEIARIDGSQAATLAAGNSLGISPIYYYGNEDQKRRWLPDLCAGKALSSFGLTEPNAGSDAGASKTNSHSRRRRMGDQWLQDLHHQFHNGDEQGLCGSGRDRETGGREERNLLYPRAQRDAGLRGKGHAWQNGLAGLQHG